MRALGNCRAPDGGAYFAYLTPRASQHFRDPHRVPNSYVAFSCAYAEPTVRVTIASSRSSERKGRIPWITNGNRLRLAACRRHAWQRSELLRATSGNGPSTL